MHLLQLYKRLSFYVFYNIKDSYGMSVDVYVLSKISNLPEIDVSCGLAPTSADDDELVYWLLIKCKV